MTLPRVLAVLKRDGTGALLRVDNVSVDSGDRVFAIPTQGGAVIVVGEVRDEDEPVLQRVLEGLQGTP